LLRVPQQKLPIPAPGLLFVQGYDQDDTDFPILGVVRDPKAGLGLTPPELGDTDSFPANSQYTAAQGFRFVGVKVTDWEERVLWTYRILPGAWGAAKETAAEDGVTITAVERVNVAANIAYGDTSASGVNTVVTSEPIDNYLAKEIRTTRPIAGPAYTLLNYSDRGDATSEAIQYVDPGSTLPSEAFGIAVKREPLTLHQSRQTTATTPAYGWIYGSIVDAETNITGNIAKTFVAASQANQAAVLTGPQTINGKTFGVTGDMVVVEYQEYTDIQMQMLLVTVFPKASVSAQSQSMPFFGSFPIPPQLTGVYFLQDPASSSSTGSGTANWSDEVTVSWDAEVAMTFIPYPEKLQAVRNRYYSIGEPTPPTPTFIRPAFGEFTVEGGEYHLSQSSWSTDTSSGNSQGVGKSVRYKFREIPPCLFQSTLVFNSPGSFHPTGTFPTVALTSATAGITGYIENSVPGIFNSGDTITEYAVEKGRYNLYIMDVNVYTLPT
jgi:hypothetical protein